MASSYYTNTLHVDFESVLAMEDLVMVSMFQALMAFVLEGFLGCPAVIYETALVDFFENASVRDDVVISTVAGQLVEISEEWFAETFELPVDGLSELSEIPKDKLFDARSIVSLTGEPVSTSGKKSEMKIEYRLLCDIMAKTISVKAGSFNAITMEKFSMLTAVVCGVRINWASEEGTCKRVVSRKRPAVAIADEPVVKNKSTTKKKSSSSKANLEMVAVAQEAVPIQMIEPIPATPVSDEEVEEQPAVEVAAETSVQEPAAEHVDEQMAEPPADVETTVEEFDEPAVEVTAEEIRTTSADDVDIIIEHVIAEIAQMGPAEEDHEVDASADGDQPADTTEERQWFDLPYEDLMARMDADRPVVTPSDTDKDEFIADEVTGTDAANDYFVEEPEEVEMSNDEQSVDERIDADEAMSLEDILFSILVDVPLPSAAVAFFMGNQQTVVHFNSEHISVVGYSVVNPVVIVIVTLNRCNQSLRYKREIFLAIS
ncbi:dystroglycan-like [Dorcoceras hygrometricum]|uniref:Dystroglycan-like n=1 Tax=Dorcoceras hygrometricum TaxID=472368 RepID=A0A2Z7BLW2_9LAMI|nr:dystroglycan-like [Dorcoceras hygrometricum]